MSYYNAPTTYKEDHYTLPQGSPWFTPGPNERCCFCLPLREGLLIFSLVLVMLDTASLYGAFLRVLHPSDGWGLPFLNISDPEFEDRDPGPLGFSPPFTNFHWIDVFQSAWELIFMVMITISIGWGTAQREGAFRYLTCGLCGFASAIIFDFVQMIWLIILVSIVGKREDLEGWKARRRPGQPLPSPPPSLHPPPPSLRGLELFGRPPLLTRRPLCLARPQIFMLWLLLIFPFMFMLGVKCFALIRLHVYKNWLLYSPGEASNLIPPGATVATQR